MSKTPGKSIPAAAMPPRNAGKNRRVWMLLAGFVLAAMAIGTGLFQWRRFELVAASRPARPTVQGWPAEFVERLDEAETETRSYIHCVSGLIALSRLYHINGFYNPALSCYDGLRALQPREAKWCHLEANILADFGRGDDAVPLYKRAIALDDHDNAARIKLGEILRRSDHPEDAASVFNDALRAQPTNPYALLGLAQLSADRGNWAGAKTTLEKALQQQPDFVGGLSLLVTVEEKLGDTAAARSVHEALGSQEFVDVADPWTSDLYADCYDAYRLSVAATVQRFAKNYPGAIALFQQAIQLAPRASAYERELGVLLADMERYDEAKPHAQRATELSPNDPYTWTLLVRVLTALKQEDAAWRALYEGLEHCPNSQDLHLARANRLQQSGRDAEAVAEFKETHRLWPSEAAPLVDLAQTYFKLGENQLALDALHEALERQPGSPSALSILAIYYIQTGDRTNAMRAYHELAEHAGALGPSLSRLQQSYLAKFGEALQ